MQSLSISAINSTSLANIESPIDLSFSSFNSLVRNFSNKKQELESMELQLLFWLNPFSINEINNTKTRVDFFKFDYLSLDNFVSNYEF